MKNKIKKIVNFVTSNVFGFSIGIVAAITLGVYAATTLSSSSVYYNNANSGGSSNTVSGALDELYELAKTTEFKVGDYVKMTPTKTSFTVPITLNGYTDGYIPDQTINPSELNLWRVIRINSDNTVDMVSEYVSSTLVYFEGQAGYQNLVGILNYIAKQYENQKYTSGSRHMGYSGQTEYITDTSALTATTAPQKSSTSGGNVTITSEPKGLGDVRYGTDYNLVNSALGTRKAYEVGTTTARSYWLASRHYYYKSSTFWDFRGRYIDTSGSLTSSLNFYYCTSGGFNWNEDVHSIRPIVTLKSGVKASSGDGTSASPYVLS